MAERNKIIFPILVLGLSLLAALILVKSRPTVEKVPPEIVPPNVRALTVHPETVPVTVRSQGTVVPRTEANLVAEVSGRIDRVAKSFEAGSFVRRGQPLVWIDDRDYQAQLANQKAALAQVEVALQREKAEAEVALQEWNALGKEGTANPLVLRQPQLQEAEAKVAATTASVQRAELDLERTTIRAPYTGRIRSTSVDQGGFANRGTPIAMIYSVDVAEIRLPVKDSELEFLDVPDNFNPSEGPAVILSTLYAGKNRVWTGHIARSEGEIDPRTQMVHLVARVEDPYGLLEPIDAPLGVGLFVNAAIEGNPLSNIYQVPRRALRRDGIVMVVEGNRLRRREVHIQRATEQFLLIDSGLEPGDQVVVSKLEVATDNMMVNPTPAELERPGFRSDSTEQEITTDEVETQSLLPAPDPSLSSNQEPGS